MYLFLYCSFYLFDLNHALYHTNLNIIYNGQVILQNTGFAMLVREHNNFLTNVIALLIVTSTKSSGMLNVNLLLPCHFLNRLLQVVWRPSYYWCYEQHQFPRSRQVLMTSLSQVRKETSGGSAVCIESVWRFRAPHWRSQWFLYPKQHSQI